MARSTVQPEIPILATLLVHALLGAGLVLADALIDDVVPKTDDPAGEMTEVETEPVVKVETKPEPEPELDDPPEDPAPVETVNQPVAARTEPVRTRTRPQPKEAPPAITAVAPGENTNDDEAAPTFKLPPNGTGGSIPVPKGVAPPKGPYGTGGTGTNTGGGGPPDSKGTAPAPKPVSVASIKTRAKPIGNVDYEKIGKAYPPDAKRLGIEGKVKVRLIVSATGAVTSRRLVVKLGHGLDQLAMKLAKKLRFEPAIDTNDKPVSSVVVWTFNFVLPR